MNGNSNKRKGRLVALYAVAWAFLGGPTAVALFLASIIGAGELLGGTEVGNGRVPGVGILWVVFFYGAIPVFILGMVVAPVVISKLPLLAQQVFAVLGVFALITLAAVALLVKNL